MPATFEVAGAVSAARTLAILGVSATAAERLDDIAGELAEKRVFQRGERFAPSGVKTAK